MQPSIFAKEGRILGKWKRVQGAALSVVALSQRDEDPSERLWYLPTSLFEELQTLAPPGSVEAKARDEVHVDRAYRRFGYPSITVSWKALAAIATATSARPAAAREVIRGLKEFQSPDGAYGSKVPRQHGHTINECARHTAMALLIQMDFGEDQTPASLIARFERPISWLLGPAALPEGGWAFEQSVRSQQEGLGGTSTVACIMALSRFAAICGPATLKAKGVYELIQEQVSKSLRALAAHRTSSGTWDLRNEGLPTETRVAESAYIVSGIRYAVRAGALASLDEEAPEILRDMQEGLLQVGLPLERGWPAEAAGLSVSPSATICALHALSDLKPHNLDTKERQLVAAAETRLLEELGRDNIWEFLRTWDWATLAELSSARVGPIGLSEWSKLYSTIVSVKQAKDASRLSRAVLRRLPMAARMAARYCLTRGLSIPLRDTLSSKMRSASSEFMQKSAWAAWTTLIGIVVGFLLSKLNLK
jgi:hypothetical protein